MSWISNVLGYVFSSSENVPPSTTEILPENNEDTRDKIIANISPTVEESHPTIYDSQEEHREPLKNEQTASNASPIVGDNQRAELLVRCMWKTYEDFVRTKEDNMAPLPQSVLYHAPSGLHNEGNWHNCIMGISYIKLFQATQNISYKESALKLGNSLFNLNFDNEAKLFNQRTHTPYWDHATGNDLYDRYVSEGKQKKLAANAMAIIFWSFVQNESEEQNKQFHLMTENFLYQFWSQQHKKWKPEASNTKYFRGVDQAIAILACLRMMKSCNADDVQNTRDHKHYLSQIISATRKSLFRDFKLTHADHKNYIGKSDSVVAWHDLWMLYAILFSSSTSSDLKKVKQIYEIFIQTHLYNGFVTANRTDPDKPVCYSNDNFLFYGLLKSMRYFFPELEFPAQFSLEKLNVLMEPNSNLFYESNQHCFVALHPQTECLFGLLVDPVDYIREDTIPKMTKNFLRKGNKRRMDSDTDVSSSDMEAYSSNNNSASENESSSSELTPRRRVTKKAKRHE